MKTLIEIPLAQKALIYRMISFAKQSNTQIQFIVIIFGSNIIDMHEVYLQQS